MSAQLAAAAGLVLPERCAGWRLPIVVLHVSPCRLLHAGASGPQCAAVALPPQVLVPQTACWAAMAMPNWRCRCPVC